MSQPVDKSNYNLLTNTQLFAHNHMQRETKRIDPYDSFDGTGVIGRMSDVLSRIGHNVGSFSANAFSVALVGEPGVSETPMIVNRDGVPDLFMSGELEKMVLSLHNSTPSDSGFFGEMWSDALVKSFSTNEILGTELSGITTNTTFPDSRLGDQFRTVSRLIATREARGVDRDTFYVEIGGFDTHADVEENLSGRFIEVNNAIEAFVTELKHMEVWDNVTIIQTSDFARTLNPNSGDGTDHAWGGNYMMIGGSVSGGQIVGEYPPDLTTEGPLNIGRGRMIPTTPWDAVFKGIATWMGVPESDLNHVCPNIGNFDASYFFDPENLFDSIPPPAPTNTPTTTISPTLKQTNNPTQSSNPTLSMSQTPSQVSSKITSHPSSVISVVPSHGPSQVSDLPSNVPSEMTSSPSLLLSKTPSSIPSHQPSQPTLTYVKIKKFTSQEKSFSKGKKWQTVLRFLLVDSNNVKVPGADLSLSYTYGSKTDVKACKSNNKGNCAIKLGRFVSKDVASIDISVDFIETPDEHKYNPDLNVKDNGCPLFSINCPIRTIDKPQ